MVIQAPNSVRTRRFKSICKDEATDYSQVPKHKIRNRSWRRFEGLTAQLLLEQDFSPEDCQQ